MTWRPAVPEVKPEDGLGLPPLQQDEPATTRKYLGNYKGRRGTLDSPLSNPSDYF
ncbi:hypothetical protein EJ02DRAFT_76743 [Clathrospora elynae]|uniref:Uncharacterized protein n=1 Tax=Clathrospora elynae TaxID=706981 RepID=A0A6A5S7X4_9PLEO|nr:hypothetical protein EJ02DRAFT_76743 [Clathrospora elynae]